MKILLPIVIVLHQQFCRSRINFPDRIKRSHSIKVAFLVAAKGYKTITVGPPPSEFTSGKVPEGFGKMMWNGEIQLTRDILIPCLQSDGTLRYDTNKYGKYLQLISWLTLVAVAVEPRYIVPIRFKRIRGNGGTTGA